MCERDNSVFALSPQIHEHLPEQYGMVQHKLTERNLQKEPGFRWCVNVSWSLFPSSVVIQIKSEYY